MGGWPEPLLSAMASSQQTGLPAPVRAYFLLIGGVLAVMGAGAIVIGVRKQSSARSLLENGVRAPGTLGCAGILVIFVGSMFGLGGLVFLALGFFLP
jgi:hypothetical protein